MLKFMLAVSFILLLFQPCVAVSEEWIRYRTDDYFDSYYDKTSITKTAPNQVKVQKKEVVRTKEARTFLIKQRESRGLPTKGYENLSYVLTLGLFDCKAKKVTMMNMSEHTSSGKVLMKINFSPDQRRWVDVPEGSIADDLRLIVCK